MSKAAKVKRAVLRSKLVEGEVWTDYGLRGQRHEGELRGIRGPSKRRKFVPRKGKKKKHTSAGCLYEEWDGVGGLLPKLVKDQISRRHGLRSEL